MFEFTKADAEALAKQDRDYVVRKIMKRHPSQIDRYGILDSRSDHWVGFDALRGAYQEYDRRRASAVTQRRRPRRQGMGRTVRACP
jgi:hypothetical protein